MKNDRTPASDITARVLSFIVLRAKENVTLFRPKEMNEKTERLRGAGCPQKMNPQSGEGYGGVGRTGRIKMDGKM
jgi:hypothetical protein